MNQYTYKISLRVVHPSLDPAEITSILGMTPDNGWRAGDARKSTHGRILPGRRKESYWTLRLINGEPEDKTLASAVHQVLDQLAPHKEFFHRIQSEGGSIEFFLGWFFEGQSGDTFDYDLLSRLVDFKIGLSFDVYAFKPEESAARDEA